MLSLFRGLRGRLILTYTLVTVLALLALEILILGGSVLLLSLVDDGSSDYLGDVVITLGPQAAQYFAAGPDGQIDQAGLQAWLEEVYASGRASLPPQYLFDSAVARIARDDPMYVLDASGMVLAQAPLGENSLVGRHYQIPPYVTDDFLQNAISGSRSAGMISTRTTRGNYWMAAPVRVNADGDSSVVAGVIVLTLEKPPPAALSYVPFLLGSVLGTAVLLLIGVAPFGALFGLIMSRGLTRRLGALSATADAWSEGNFIPAPVDRSRDEIGLLGARMRHMAARIQELLKSQKALALMEERNRLARELHDTVKQQNFATLMQVRAARNLLERDPQAAGESLAQAEELIKSSQQELSLIIAELRPAALDEQGLAGALRQYAAALAQSAHIPAEVEVRGERALPMELEQALYRVAQEALSNAARHSRASAIHLALEYTRDQVLMTIQDNGVGFDLTQLPASGYGLRTMRERTEALGGELTIQSIPGEGTKVTVEVTI